MMDKKPQLYRPPVRTSNRYAVFNAKEPQAISNPLFSMTITASIKEESMNEAELNEDFLIDLVFKPNESGLRLRPAETQLLLAYIGEILKELEDEEKLTIAAQKASENNEAIPCK